MFKAGTKVYSKSLKRNLIISHFCINDNELNLLWICIDPNDVDNDNRCNIFKCHEIDLKLGWETEYNNKLNIKDGKSNVESQKEYISINKLINTFEDMAKRGTLLARGGVSQQDLLVQIIGTIVHTAGLDRVK